MSNTLLHKLRDVLSTVEDSTYLTSVAGTPTMDGVRDAFDQLFSKQDQEQFCRVVKKDPQSSQTFFKQHLIAPKPAALTAFLNLDKMNQEFADSSRSLASSSAAEYDSFCTTFRSTYFAANLYSKFEDLASFGQRAGAYLDANDTLNAFRLYNSLFAAEPWFAGTDAQAPLLFDSLLPKAFLAAACEPYANTLRLSADWGARLFSSPSQASTSVTTANQGLNKSNAKPIFHATYLVLTKLLDMDVAEDSRSISFFRAHRLYTALHTYIHTRSGAEPQDDVLAIWRPAYSTKHTLLAERLTAAYDTKCFPFALNCTFSLPTESILSSYPPIPTVFDTPECSTIAAYLGLGWVQDLKHDLQLTSMKISVDPKTAAAIDRTPLASRAYCLHSAPGTGKTEALKIIMAHFSRESRGPDALKKGWHGPVIGRYVDSNEFFGSHYSETANNISRIIHKTINDAQQINGIPFVIIDEVNLFLAGGDVQHQPEENKNMHQLSAFLDNSVPGSHLFILCTTNDMSSLSSQAQSRLKGKSVKYTTPFSIRSTVAKKIMKSIAADNLFATKPIPDSSLLTFTSMEEQNRSLTSICNVLFVNTSLREYSLMPELLSRYEHLQVSARLLRLVQVRRPNEQQKRYSIIDSEDFKISAISTLDKESIFFTIRDDHFENYRTNMVNTTGDSFAHIGTEIGPKDSFSIFVNGEGFHILTLGNDQSSLFEREFSYQTVLASSQETSISDNDLVGSSTRTSLCRRSISLDYKGQEPMAWNGLIKFPFDSMDFSGNVDGNTTDYLWHIWCISRRPLPPLPRRTIVDIMNGR